MKIIMKYLNENFHSIKNLLDEKNYSIDRNRQTFFDLKENKNNNKSDISSSWIVTDRVDEWMSDHSGK